MIQKNVLENKKFYVYGYGEYTKHLLEHFFEIGLTPKAIFDKYKYGKINEYFGKIESIKAYDIDYSLPILITILGYPEVSIDLNNIGLRNQIETLEIFKMFPESLKKLVNDSFMWRQQPESYELEEERETQLINILGDKLSINTFKLLMSFRKAPSIENYILPESYTMYFPNKIKQLYQYKTKSILDIGAFDGDTMEDFIKRFHKEIKSYTCIEASQINIAKLKQRVIDNKLEIENLNIIYGAVGVITNEKYIYFENQGSASSIMEEQSLTCSKVPIIDLSEVIENYNPNIIKMDIEGSDMNALIQMKEYIVDQRPTLALSIYHQPNDLWEMPLYIHNISNGGYIFYLRQEGHWGLETQLYAIPSHL